MSDIGKLVVSLEANVAKFTSDIGRAATEHERAMKMIADKADLAGNAMRVLGMAAKTLGAGLAVGLTFNKFKSEIEGVIKSAAGLQQLAERTGATVEGLSGIASAAKLSGTDVEALGGGLQKLAKAMIDAQSGGKATTSAFEAIGISVKDLKGQSTDQVFALIADRLSQYKDGADKVALAQVLLGKSGANLLPVLKDLVDIGGMQAKVTTDQAEMADRYEKTLVRLNAAQGKVYKVIGFELLPVMQAFAESVLSVTTKGDGLTGAVTKLAKDNTLRDWAQNTAMALAITVETMTTLIKGTRALIGSFEVVWADLSLAKSFLAGGEGLNPFSDKNKATLKAALDERNATVKAANERYVELWNMDKTPLSRTLAERFAVMNGGDGAGRGFVNPQRAAPKDLVFRKPDEDKSREGERFIENLQRQVEAQTHGRMEMLRLEAAQKGVSAAAAPYIQQLEDIESRQARIKRVVEEAAKAEAQRAKITGFIGLADDMTKHLINQAEDLGLNAEQQRRVQEMRRLEDEYKRAMVGADSETRAELDQVYESKRKNLSAALDSLDERERALRANAGLGLRRGIETWARDVADQAKWAENFFTGAMSRMEDSLVNFVKTGKLNFSSLFGFMAEEYLRNLIRMSMQNTAAPNGSFIGWSSMFSTVAGWFGFGRHASGLDYVPTDNYPALLHRGERVQTAVEASAARNASGQTIHFDFSGQTLNVGQGVSRSEVAAALQANQAQTVERIRRLERQGRFA